MNFPLDRLIYWFVFKSHLISQFYPSCLPFSSSSTYRLHTIYKMLFRLFHIFFNYVSPLVLLLFISVLYFPSFHIPPLSSQVVSPSQLTFFVKNMWNMMFFRLRGISRYCVLWGKREDIFMSHNFERTSRSRISCLSTHFQASQMDPTHSITTHNTRIYGVCHCDNPFILKTVSEEQ